MHLISPLSLFQETKPKFRNWIKTFMFFLVATFLTILSSTFGNNFVALQQTHTHTHTHIHTLTPPHTHVLVLLYLPITVFERSSRSLVSIANSGLAMITKNEPFKNDMHWHKKTDFKKWFLFFFYMFDKKLYNPWIKTGK